jgi:hypothetical protein
MNSDDENNDNNNLKKPSNNKYMRKAQTGSEERKFNFRK